MNRKILVLGVGNYLMGDEGLGVHFAKQFQEEELPDGVTVLDGGTAGFQLMEYLESHPLVIMIDATLDHNPPGTIRMIEPRFATDFPRAMSTHEIGLKDLVESLVLINRLPKIYLFVVSIANLSQLQVTLSPEVEQALVQLKQRVRQLIDQHLD